MAAANVRQLWELVEAADVAVRSASQLRQLKRGRPIRDQESLRRVAEFLETAIQGGVFLSGQNAQFSGDTLRPFNWVTDTYRITHRDRTAPDYEDLVRFLATVRETVLAAVEEREPEPASIEEAALFLHRLGGLLAAQAEGSLRRQSAPHRPTILA